MIDAVGFIGVGHLATYLVEGLRKANPDLTILLSKFKGDFTASLAKRFAATAVEDNQAVVDGADLVVVSTRPDNMVSACERVSFRPEHTVVSTAAGISLATLEPAVAPAPPGSRRCSHRAGALRGGAFPTGSGSHRP